jgi:hypothetical protein
VRRGRGLSRSEQSSQREKQRRSFAHPHDSTPPHRHMDRA